MEEENSMIEERMELMVPSISGAIIPTFRKAHFLKPVSNTSDQPSPHLSSLSHPLNTSYMQLIKQRVRFHGMLGPLKLWTSWVDDLQKTHQETWKKVGIFDAIKASTYHIMRDNELIIELAERWCAETNTFFFPWGESTITLEDVMILGGFSVLGSSARSRFRLTEGGEIVENLIFTWRKIKKSHNFHATHNIWMNYFRGKGGELEHVALLVLWLSRYVFTSNSRSVISSKVFSIAVSLTRGIRIALAPAILASIYRDLGLLHEKIVNINSGGQDACSKLVLWAPLQLVQIWAWERLPTLGLKPNLLGHGQPRVARWHQVRKSKVRLVIEWSTGDDFLWRPYALHLRNWELPKFYCHQGTWILVNSEMDEQFSSFVKCLRTCELIGVDCVERYLPKRVARQFALDQDIPFSLPRQSAASEVAWNSFDKPLDGLKFYIPPQLFEGGVTFQYSEWWKSLVFLHDNCEAKNRGTRKLKEVFKVIFDADHDGYGKEIPSCSSYEAVGLISFGSGREMQNENFSSYKANELGEGIRISLQVGRNGADKCRDNFMTEGEERMVNWSNINMGEGSTISNETHRPNKKHVARSSPAIKEAMGSNSVGNGSDMVIRNSPSCKVIPSEDLEYVADQIELANMRNPLKGLEKDIGDFERTYTQDKGHGTLSGAEPLSGAQVNTFSCALVRDKQGEERVDAKSKQGNNAHDDFVTISDEEDYSPCDALVAQGLAFDARISRLESMVSALQAAKLKFKPAYVESAPSK